MVIFHSYVKVYQGTFGWFVIEGSTFSQHIQHGQADARRQGDPRGCAERIVPGPL